MDLIAESIAGGHKALSEHASKKFLATYGIPVSREFLVRSEKEALEYATKVGYPLVVKACGPELAHKTEGNLVRLHIKTPEEVQAAYRDLTAHANPQWEGILIQEMIPGHRELVIGLIRDSQFGPCVMFGLGGILTEVLNDVTFRVAPLEKYDALEMVSEIRAKKILEPFRGEPPVDLEVLSSCLIALGKIGLDNPLIKEIDINPLKVRDGYPIAVDALVVLSDPKESVPAH